MACHRSRDWLWLTFFLAPAVAGVWSTPCFPTQDGPIHLYNARIVLAELRGETTFQDEFAIEWAPFTNCLGQLGLAGLLLGLPPWVAHQVMVTVTLCGFAAAIFWLRRRVAGREGSVVAATLSVFLAINLIWLLGFEGFLIGCSIGLLVIGFWWRSREGISLGNAIALAAMFLLVYLTHLASLALTVLSLLGLAIATPGSNRRRRLLILFLALLPLIPFGIEYLSQMQAIGSVRPQWNVLSHPESISSWLSRWIWSDPFSLAGKSHRPLFGGDAGRFHPFVPLLWFALALLLLTAHSIRVGWSEIRAERRAFAILGIVLLLVAVIGPEEVGRGHGGNLPRRISLLGFVLLVPVWKMELRRRAVQIAFTCLLVAWVLQSAVVWDYARFSRAYIDELVEAGERMSKGRHRIVSLTTITGTPFRVNPTLHLDAFLGAVGDDLILSNYQAGRYYYPVDFRDRSLDRLPARLETVSVEAAARVSDGATARWNRLLSSHQGQIDFLMVWGATHPRFDAITSRWFDPEPGYVGEHLRVFRYRR